MPAITLPRVSCRERPITAVRTVEVAMSPETLKPEREAATKKAATPAVATRTSLRIRGARRPSRDATTAKRKLASRPMTARACRRETTATVSR